MSRATLAWVTFSMVIAAAGCRMCASPYDHCRPTFTGQCGEDCDPHARSGSILSGYFPAPADFAPDRSPDDLVPDVPPGEEPPLPLGPSAADEPAEQTPPVEAGVAEESPVLRWQGWTAKRNETRVQ